jgi:ADP-heptose:LPS heptosyltransferase
LTVCGGINDLNPDDLSIFKKSKYIEFVGGLGDMFIQLYDHNWYKSLGSIPEGQKLSIGLLVHNPFADEIFRWHPAANRLLILKFGYKHRWLDPAWRTSFGLPDRSPLHSNPSQPQKALEYNPSPDDIEPLAQAFLLGKYAVMQLSAGTPERSIPKRIYEEMIQVFESRRMPVVKIGRTYKHLIEGSWPAHHEIDVGQKNSVLDLTDKLTVPGTARLIEGATCVVTAFTSIVLLAWFLRKPVFTVYDIGIKTQVLPIGPVGFAFGINRLDTDHATFDEYSSGRFTSWVSRVT